MVCGLESGGVLEGLSETLARMVVLWQEIKRLFLLTLSLLSPLSNVRMDD